MEDINHLTVKGSFWTLFCSSWCDARDAFDHDSLDFQLWATLLCCK